MMFLFFVEIVVFFPCLFSVKNLLNLFIDDYYNMQRYKIVWE